MPNPTTAGDSDRELTLENEIFLRQYIERLSGINLGEDKRYLLRSRLMPIVLQMNLASLNDLCNHLRTSPSEALRCSVLEAMTTHETLFFRDIAVFDCLRTTLLPEIASQHKTTKTMRIWSAACSSGQEAYSIAMVLHESGYSDWNIQILGTDLSTQIVERASRGKYLQMEVNRGLPIHLLVKHFQQSGKDWQVKDHLRRMVSFSLFDLRQEMHSLGSFDLVFCRNVLIYFDLQTRKKILAAMQKTLFPGGYLVLGSSENGFSNEGYVQKTIGNVVLYQKPMFMHASMSP